MKIQLLMSLLPIEARRKSCVSYASRYRSAAVAEFFAPTIFILRLLFIISGINFILRKAPSGNKKK